MPCWQVLTQREQVFVMSLMYHGFRCVGYRKGFKKRIGYVVPATKREDASGIDVWVNMPGSHVLLPVQVTQRGVRLFRKHKNPTQAEVSTFMRESNARIGKKKRRSHKNGIAFALVRDFDGNRTNSCIAWGDIKALRYAISQYHRQRRR